MTYRANFNEHTKRILSRKAQIPPQVLAKPAHLARRWHTEHIQLASRSEACPTPGPVSAQALYGNVEFAQAGWQTWNISIHPIA